MDFSLSSTAVKGSLFSSSPPGIYLSKESLFQKSGQPLPRNRILLSFTASQTSLQTLFGQTKTLSKKQRHVKVFCIQKTDVGIPVVDGRCVHEIYDTLAERLFPMAAAASNSNQKYLVGLAAPPGAGKSTLVNQVVKRVNQLWNQNASPDSREVATVLPMDGFHLYRSQLDAMENPEEAHARRGAPWTFDPERLLNCLKTLRIHGSVYAPSFDHTVGDPVEDDIFVGIEHKVVIVEGNYILSDDGVWKEISSFFDEKWFIDLDIDTAMNRVLRRHILTGKSPDLAKKLVEYNDRRNAEFIMNSKKNADIIIKSVDF